MIKKLIIGIVFLSCALFTNAQNPFGIEIEDNRKTMFSIAPKVGVIMSNQSQPTEIDLFDGIGIGYKAGLQAKVRFGQATDNSPIGTGYLGTAIEFLYTHLYAKTIGTDNSGNTNAYLSLSYIEIPLSMQYYPFANNEDLNTLFVEIGVSIYANTGCNPESITVSNPSTDMESLTYHFNDNLGKLKASDIKPFIGIGYKMPHNGLGINARYSFGTSNAAGNFPCKINTAEISFTWQINIGRF